MGFFPTACNWSTGDRSPDINERILQELMCECHSFVMSHVAICMHKADITSVGFLNFGLNIVIGKCYLLNK